MRITGGMARGIPLSVGKAAGVRPATDRMREAVFSSLGPLVEGAQFIDLFAGVGSYGLEALSRGAGGGIFVEQDRKAVAALEQNLASVARSLGMGRVPAKVVTMDALKFQVEGDFTLIFADPPYSMLPHGARAIFEVVDTCLARDTGVPARFCFECPGELELAHPDWIQVRRLGKGRGQPTVGIYQRKSDCDPD